jgi:hypothetical protein
VDRSLVVDLGEGRRAGRSDCLSMVQESHRKFAGVGIDFLGDIDCAVGIVEEDSLGRRELAVVEVLDHS